MKIEKHLNKGEIILIRGEKSILYLVFVLGITLVAITGFICFSLTIIVSLLGGDSHLELLCGKEFVFDIKLILADLGSIFFAVVGIYILIHFFKCNIYITDKRVIIKNNADIDSLNFEEIISCQAVHSKISYVHIKTINDVDFKIDFLTLNNVFTIEDEINNKIRVYLNK